MSEKYRQFGLLGEDLDITVMSREELDAKRIADEAAHQAALAQKKQNKADEQTRRFDWRRLGVQIAGRGRTGSD